MKLLPCAGTNSVYSVLETALGWKVWQQNYDMTNVKITEHSRQSCAMSPLVHKQSVQGSTWRKTSVMFSTKSRQQHNSVLYRSVINIFHYTIKHFLVLVSFRFTNRTFFLNVYICAQILVRQIIDKMWYSNPLTSLSLLCQNHTFRENYFLQLQGIWAFLAKHHIMPSVSTIIERTQRV
jgi:hypothetical protein